MPLLPLNTPKDEIDRKVTRLETDLTKSEATSKSLTERLNEAEAQKQLILAESKAMEARYKETLEQRDQDIRVLQSDIVDLRATIERKDVIIKTQKQKIDRYENSFRQIARLSVLVTGNKVKSAGSVFKQLIQNPTSDESDDEKEGP